MTPGDGKRDTETFSEALRRLLKDADGLSQRQLASRMAGPDASPERVESVRRQVVGWASGDPVPNRDSVLWIAETLGADPEPLLAARANSSVRTQVRQLAAGLNDVQDQLAETRSHLDGRLDQFESRLRDVEGGRAG